MPILLVFCAVSLILAIVTTKIFASVTCLLVLALIFCVSLMGFLITYDYVLGKEVKMSYKKMKKVYHLNPNRWSYSELNGIHYQPDDGMYVSISLTGLGYLHFQIDRCLSKKREEQKINDRAMEKMIKSIKRDIKKEGRI